MKARKRKEFDKTIDDVRSLLDEAEGEPRKPAKKSDPDELDVDAAWSKK